MAYVIKLRTRYRSDATGREILLPALFTEKGILISLLRFLASMRRSESWREKCVFAVKLLIEYINANVDCFAKATQLLENFSISLVIGTIRLEDSTDSSGLYWPPRKPNDAQDILRMVTCYTDWLATQDGYSNSRINPFRSATSTEQRLNWCAYYHKKYHVFMSHLMSAAEAASKAAYVRCVQVSGVSKTKLDEVKRFPESNIHCLLDDGFIVAKKPGDNYEVAVPDYKAQAITILLHYGGLRRSEVPQLYLSDIQIDEKRNEAIVRVFHPANGESPDPAYRTRRELLISRYGLLPRNEYPKSKRLHAGWKDPLLTDARGCFQVYFFPPDAARLFLVAFRNYLMFQRVDPPEWADHPYAFTNSVGTPETIKNFQRIHTAAVQRIGLQHRKCLGTTEHGHRHSYGYRLSAHGFSQVEIQKAMHHQNPDSCLIYTESTSSEIRERMRIIDSWAL
ncbi:gamma-mobile-trio recombinase GmtY [Pseudomonas azerbaijanoccidentalis]